MRFERGGAVAVAGGAIAVALLAGCGSDHDSAAPAASSSAMAASPRAATSTAPGAARNPAPASPAVPAQPVPAAQPNTLAPNGSAQSPTAAQAPAPAAGAAPTATDHSVPTVGQLNAMVSDALDPSVPASAKADDVQGGAADPGLFDQLGAMRAQYPGASVSMVGPVTANPDGTATATAQVGFGGQSRSVPLSFVDEGGKWKLSRTDACHFIELAGKTSPICG